MVAAAWVPVMSQAYGPTLYMLHAPHSYNRGDVKAMEIRFNFFNW